MEATVAKPAQTLKPNHGIISGRVVAVRQFDTQNGKQFEHLMTLPAPDQYSSPGRVAVSASSRLGAAGDDLRILCELTGFPRSWKDGDGVQINTATNIFRAVE